MTMHSLALRAGIVGALATRGIRLAGKTGPSVPFRGVERRRGTIR